MTILQLFLRLLGAPHYSLILDDILPVCHIRSIKPFEILLETASQDVVKSHARAPEKLSRQLGLARVVT
ncbi:hypothetical protein K443DRAFT_493385 [Laccaria amethystina LaAM-08-1]|uniref:Uncharacterized protein n=1 Tax=Laccaria amethystina LaAM-08-1 TaxID=1095629 RepID=A0A0C9YEG4_9AGAR|nr:hypothetical protein K443DRAFT_493385 [Laccaria amethystina LaAM-08-1]